MANNYYEWSETLKVETDAERAWVKQYVARADPEDGGDDWGKMPQYVKALGYSDGAPFEFELDDDGLWMHSAYGYMDEAIDVIRVFLSRFAADSSFILRWAEYCDKPRVGEFGGGACRITADAVTCIHTTDLERN
jgi:hypothetical protein